MTYTRRKAASECFNGEKFERPVTRKNCACTEENYDCEMGFARRIGSTDCRLVDENLVEVPEKCTSSDFYYVDSHRRVVGDSCEGGWQPQRLAVPCPANSRLSRGAQSVLGTIAMIVVVLAGVTYISRSERFKGVFSNYGFENFNDVQYAGIGQKMPEMALESVGARYDADFFDGEQDEFGDDPPPLMSYTDRERDREPTKRLGGGLEQAASAVPRLQAPPGGNGATPAAQDESLDLL